jgi:DNA-binding GntR family transcriptional regulator
MENFIKHKSLVEQIVQGLEKKILEGNLKPGQRVIEGTLCKTLGVSRSPVREAFRILESKGFVTSEPRKGISVATITSQEAEDIYMIRATLEGLATYLAVKRRDPKVLKKLKEFHRQMGKVPVKTNVNAYFNLNIKFHETLIHACENNRLIELIHNFDKQTRRYRLEAISIQGWINSSIKIHDTIIQAFESGDAEEAEQLRKKMILSQIDRFSKKIKMEEKSEDRS